MKQTSPWINKKQRYPTLRKDISCDVVIIGGGITGISCAFHLRKLGKKVALLEKDVLASGLGGNATGSLTPGWDMDFFDMIRIHGTKKTKQYLKLTRNGMKEIEQLIRKQNISCNFIKNGSLALASTKEELLTLYKDAKARRKLGAPFKIIRSQKLKNIIGTNAQAAIYDKHNATLIPSKLIVELAKKCSAQIYERTEVRNIQRDSRYIVTTPHAKIKARKVVIATQNSFYIKPKKRINIQRVPVIATNLLSKRQLNSIAWNTAHCLWSFGREYYLLRLTPDNRLMMTGSNENATAKQILNDLKKIFPQLTVRAEYYWDCQMPYTQDDQPIIACSNSLGYSFAYAGHGLIAGYVAGKKIARKFTS
ncbi:MAG TPA: FAD-dependent oxidoreductase [Acidobacteriota bacterium]|nr:FAD-dependent oxidoreductase [Acidobacteriota bacterium]